MKKKIQLLDCTLRDGAYIVDSFFGVPAIKGIIKRMQDANVDIIECGWLKDSIHKPGTTFFHKPSDIEPYLSGKDGHTSYVAMIDWDRYNLNVLPEYDGRSIDAVRVVFPQEKFREGIALGQEIRKKGYQVYFQAANTLGYSDEELMELAGEVNRACPKCLSVVDTFGAMYWEDLEHIVSVLDRYLDSNIRLGFHSHNNQQLSFALSMQFVKMLYEGERDIMLDASLCGMGRGAGNAATELTAGFLNRKYQGNYNMNVILDAIDIYMSDFTEHYTWGYSAPYLIAGMYGAHVNNIAYLMENHRTSAKDMRSIIESMAVSDRKKYNYDLLEEKYLDYQSKSISDEDTREYLQCKFAGRPVLLLMPGKSLLLQKERIHAYIEKQQPVVIGINAVLEGYPYNYLFFSNRARYDYAKEIYPQLFDSYQRILSSNVKTKPEDGEILVNYHLLIKRGWEHFDNAGIMCLRLLNLLKVQEVALAGFDGFEDEYELSYADVSMPYIDPGKKWAALNEEIRDIFKDFKQMTDGEMHITFLTESKYVDDE